MYCAEITYRKCCRPVRLKEEIAGILLNPNCRYEANFLPFYTLAEWNNCHADADVLEGIATMLIFDHLEIVLVRYSFSEGVSCLLPLVDIYIFKNNIISNKFAVFMCSRTLKSFFCL